MSYAAVEGSWINTVPTLGELTVSCVQDATAFARLQKEWDALQLRNTSSTVFMSWAWHHTWWTVFGRDHHKLYIVCVRAEGRLIGLLPLYQRVRPWPRPNQVMFVGTGEGDSDEVATEYLDILVDENYQREAALAALTYIEQEGQQMRFEFTHVLDDSVLVKSIEQHFPNWHLQFKDLGFRYRIDLEAVSDDIPMQPERIKRVKRSLRAVERDGGFRHESVASIEDVAMALDDVATLSDQRQKHLGRAKSAFASRKFNEFHRRVFPLLYQLDSADVHNFYHGPELVASLYCFYSDSTCHYYQSGFVQSMANRYMPLTVAHLREITRNRTAGRRYYDFMRGDTESYKGDFQCEKTPMLTVVRYPTAFDQWLHQTFTIVRRLVVCNLRRVGVSRRR